MIRPLLCQLQSQKPLERDVLVHRVRQLSFCRLPDRFLNIFPSSLLAISFAILSLFPHM